MLQRLPYNTASLRAWASATGTLERMWISVSPSRVGTLSVSVIRRTVIVSPLLRVSHAHQLFIDRTTAGVTLCVGHDRAARLAAARAGAPRTRLADACQTSGPGCRSCDLRSTVDPRCTVLEHLEIKLRSWAWPSSLRITSVINIRC